MKKKILFTIGALDNGGVAKSLLSLLTVIDKEHYDISLLNASRLSSQLYSGELISCDDTPNFSSFDVYRKEQEETSFKHLHKYIN